MYNTNHYCQTTFNRCNCCSLRKTIKIKTIVVAKGIHESPTLRVDAILNVSFLANNKSLKVLFLMLNYHK
jgi:hypothetical protein